MFRSAAGLTRGLALLAVTSCGGLADGEYYGQVLFEIEGSVQAETVYDFEGQVGVALLWTHDDAVADVQTVLVETEFPARYRIKIYKEPAEDSRVQVIGGQTLQASVGQILLYEDHDEDGVWNEETEPLIGGAYNAAVLYVPDGPLPYEDPDLVSAIEDGLVPQPLWTPSQGFHLVNVAPGPFCQLDWESWMERADERHATLHIGYYAGLGADWDCDGQADFEAPSLDGSDDYFDDECAPDEILLEECDLLREVLVDFSATDPSDAAYQDWLQGWFPDAQYASCFLNVCPDVVGDFTDFVEPECLEIDLREQGCDELATALQDPTFEAVGDWMGEWIGSQIDWLCFEEVCPQLLDQTFEAPPVDDPADQCPPFGAVVEACDQLGGYVDQGLDPEDWADEWLYWEHPWCFDDQCPGLTGMLYEECPPPGDVEAACVDLEGLLQSGSPTDGWQQQWGYALRPWCFDDACPEHTQAIP